MFEYEDELKISPVIFYKVYLKFGFSKSVMSANSKLSTFCAFISSSNLSRFLFSLIFNNRNADKK